MIMGMCRDCLRLQGAERDLDDDDSDLEEYGLDFDNIQSRYMYFAEVNE